jgi:hypothetical protein
MAEWVASVQVTIGSETRAARANVVSLDGTPVPGMPPAAQPAMTPVIAIAITVLMSRN